VGDGAAAGVGAASVRCGYPTNLARSSSMTTEAERDLSAILREYDQVRVKYKQLAEKLQGLLTALLFENDLRVHSVTSRLKDRGSLEAKLQNSQTEYSTLDEVTDLSGIRVITYFSKDVDKVGDIIKREFSIDSANTVDKRLALDPDRFGYLSLHYVVSISGARAGLAEYRRFPNMKSEIQVRSILQHAWADIEHDLGYKAAAEVPRHIRRRFSRVAGLLELADEEFESIRHELGQYRRSVPKKIQVSPQKVSLDKLSLAEFVDSSRVVARIDTSIAAVGGAEISTRSNLGISVRSLQVLGITTIAQLEEALIKREQSIEAFAALWLQNRPRKELRRGIALYFMRYVIIGEKQDTSLAKQALANLASAKSSHDALIARVFRTYKRIAKQPDLQKE
jgi:putative GTP pyrophosphokinase